MHCRFSFPLDARFVRAHAYAFLVLVAGLLAVPSLPAQMQPNPAKRSQTRTAEGSLYSMEGHVLAMSDGNPLNRARVSLVDFQGRSIGFTMTDDEGMFIFYDLPAGTYTLSVIHPGQPEHTERVELTVASIRGMRVVVGDAVRAVKQAPGHTLPVWAQKIPEDARKEYEAGLQALQTDEWTKGAEHFEAAIRIYPQYASALGALGTMRMRLNQRAEAVAAYESALKIDENMVDANFALGAIHSAEKRYPEAEKHLLRARLVKADEWRILFELGQVYWRMGNLPAAEENLTRAKTIHPEYARLHLILINVLATQDKLPEGLAAMEEYLDLFPKDPFADQVRQKRDLLKAHLAKEPAAAKKP